MLPTNGVVLSKVAFSAERRTACSNASWTIKLEKPSAGPRRGRFTSCPAARRSQPFDQVVRNG